MQCIISVCLFLGDFMIFLSQIVNVPIIDSKDDVIGYLKDVVFNAKTKNGDYPRVEGLIFFAGGDMNFIPYTCIENLSRAEVTLNRSNCWKGHYELSTDEVLLVRDVLDQQIFDVEGIRVVRVNDLQLSKIDDDFAVVGIDVSNKALMRRLGLSQFPFIRSMQSKFIDWHNVNLVKGNIGSLKLKTPYKKLEKLHPADLANLIEDLTLHQSTKLVQAIDTEKAAEVLGEVEPEYKGTLIEHINPQNLASILEEMPTDEAADVIQDLSEHKRVQVFRRLGIRKAKMLHKLTTYEEDHAGGLMNAEYMRVAEDETVKEAIKEIRKKSDEHRSIYHVFVIDKDNALIGIVSIRTLLLADKDEKIGKLMSKVVKTVKISTHASEVARIMTKYNLLSVAVVDRKKHLKGIITVDDIMRLLVPDA